MSKMDHRLYCRSILEFGWDGSIDVDEKHCTCDANRAPVIEWSDSLENDGTYEYTISSDCDGSNAKRWRRLPEATVPASKWEEV